MGMGREHLYKAKRVNWKELPKEEWWVEGDLIHEPYGTVIQYYEDEIKDKGNCAKISKKKRIKVVVDSETVCEYTGLADKNGRKIFEGDIVKIGLEYYEVWWNCDSSSITLSSENESRGLYLSHNETIEVTGNVFDNSELLEGGDAE